MKYFIIENTTDAEVSENIEQVKGVKHNCDIWNDKNFIDKSPFVEIKKTPILSNIILNPKSDNTDLIKAGGVGFSFGSMLISSKLKNILTQFNCFGIQFFETYLIKDNTKIQNYWQTHISEISYKNIDFSNTKILLKDRDKNRKPIEKYLDKTNEEDFINMVKFIEYPKMIFLKNLSFKKDIDFDYFFIRHYEGIGYGIVSEKLKKAIEKEKITGINFKEII